MNKVYGSYFLLICLFYCYSIDLKGKICVSIYICRYDIVEYMYKYNVY